MVPRKKLVGTKMPSVCDQGIKIGWCESGHFFPVLCQWPVGVRNACRWLLGSQNGLSPRNEEYPKVSGLWETGRKMRLCQLIAGENNRA